ncbi:MAG TPA: OadG family protein [Candidatus Atribacteria bacterium]|nr:OadG family protein [Candidatus Atribacteria bacterium]HPT78006.1 OadG family protein [Candidatus Atribacteria bacterium]
MSFGDSLLVSVFSMALVFAVLVALYFLILAFSKTIGKAKVSPEESAAPETAGTAAQPVSLAEGTAGQDMSAGTLKLKNVDEKTAAMIMAIVSHESNIPLSELQFKSIRLIDEKY